MPMVIMVIRCKFGNYLHDVEKKAFELTWNIIGLAANYCLDEASKTLNEKSITVHVL
jgi:hypothetical protein